MLTTILSALCAISLSAGEVSAPVDTLENYIIDGVAVSDFNGSQLVGKTVAEYEVVFNKAGGHVIRTHNIKTLSFASSGTVVADGDVKVVSYGTMPGNETISIRTLPGSGVEPNFFDYIIDGKNADIEEFRKLKPSDISMMEIQKGDKPVIKITTKRAK